jgi:probable DNA metabolism protein
LTHAYRATFAPEWDLDAWRAAARHALRAQLEPSQLEWQAGAQAGLLALPELAHAPLRCAAPTVAADFVTLAATVLCHRDPSRHALLYRILWRLTHGERALLDRASDPDVHAAAQLAQAVRRDAHKMKAFIRFRAVPGEADAFIAWFEPQHYVVDHVAGFFERRFAGMRWAILTPYRSLRWDGASLAFGAGAQRADAPADDARETLWRAYYANIFNPARANARMMQQEMPRRYWHLLPEAGLIPGLLHDAGRRVDDMAAREAQAPRRRIPAPPVPPIARDVDAFDALRDAVDACRACELWQPATRAVPGAGARDARIVIVGEQPGDREDLSGRPFVGPAGQLLDRALAELGLEREALWLTNAVKHFRFEPRGKARLHRNPAARHVGACRPWLERELALLQPQAIVCLGATAAGAVLGRAFRLQRQRGRWWPLHGGSVALATVHPAWILRQPEAQRDAAWNGFVADLAALRTLPETARAS